MNHYSWLQEREYHGKGDLKKLTSPVLGCLQGNNIEIAKVTTWGKEARQVFSSHLPSFESTDLSVITNSNIYFKPTKGWVLFTLQLRNENICFYVTGLFLGLTWKLLCSLPDHTLLGHRSTKGQAHVTYWMSFLALDFFWLDISIWRVGTGTHFFDLGLLHLECWGKKCYLSLQTNFHFHTTKRDRCPLERRPCHPFNCCLTPQHMDSIKLNINI